MKHKVKYYIPGSFFPEEESAVLAERSVDEALAKAPASAFAFELYDVEDAPDLGPDFRVTPVPKNKSGRYYIDAVPYTADEVKALGDDFDILLSNMRSNDWRRMVRCRTGNWQPLRENDQIVFT